MYWFVIFKAPSDYRMCPLASTGSYCPDNGTSQPLPCPPGWFSTPGQTYCSSCNDTSSLCGGAVAPRWSQSAHRSSQANTCRAGTYKDMREELVCVICPAGWCLSLPAAICIPTFYLLVGTSVYLHMVFLFPRVLLCRWCSCTMSCRNLWL